jgi:hypothetical protein
MSRKKLTLPQALSSPQAKNPTDGKNLATPDYEVQYSGREVLTHARQISTS